MSKGISIHTGIDTLRVGVYNTEAPLNAPSHDAWAMADIARHEGYSEINLLINQEATKKHFLEIFDASIQKLQCGDTLFISFSGHGGQIVDEDGDELDGRDEVWCFYDDYLVDDDLRERWRLFTEGVRVIVVSSSCHSRSTLKVYHKDCFSGSVFTPDSTCQHTVTQNGKSILEAYFPDPLIKAGIVHLSACEDCQEAEDGGKYSAFTRVLLKHWDEGRFTGTYEDLVRKIQLETGYMQKAGIATLGNNDPVLLNSIPFKLLTHKNHKP